MDCCEVTASFPRCETYAASKGLVHPAAGDVRDETRTPSTIRYSPMDRTPHCTREARAALGVVVVDAAAAVVVVAAAAAVAVIARALLEALEAVHFVPIPDLTVAF